jgi:hypothetical protein
LIIRVNLPTHDEAVLNEHRENGTDPTQQRVYAILAALNNIDCREEATRNLVEKLLYYCEFVCSKAEIDPMHAEAVRLGYAQGRAAKPAAQGEGEG